MILHKRLGRWERLHTIFGALALVSIVGLASLVVTLAAPAAQAAPVNPIVPAPFPSPPPLPPPPPPPFPPTSTIHDGRDQLQPGQRLMADHYLRSGNGQYILLMQGDGNLVLYRSSGAVVWATNTHGSGAAYLSLQHDGNAVLYRNDGSSVWATHTDGYPTERFQVKDDARLEAWAYTTLLWDSQRNRIVPAKSQATFVAGKLQYQDSYGLRPIVNNRVEIWRYAPHIAGFIWSWAADMTVATDDYGQFSVAFPYSNDGIIYAVRVAAANDAAVVFRAGSNPMSPMVFWTPARQPDGQELKHMVHGAGQTIGFNYNVTDVNEARYFNITDTLRYGQAYALQHRDPRETETVGPVNVSFGCQFGGAWYYPMADTINLCPDDGMKDGLLLHEYGHFLQDQMGVMPWNMVNHDGCATTDIFENTVNSAGHEWMEAFADYFAAVVIDTGPQEMRDGVLQTVFGGGKNYWPERRETPDKCTLDVEPHEIEDYIAAVLWDLHDDSQATEPADNVRGLQTQIFQAFDRELDIALGFPTLENMRLALINRGAITASAWDDIANLNRTMTRADDGNPVGALQRANGVAGGFIDLNGWVIDPDAQTITSAVHVYIDGPLGSGARQVVVPAAVERPYLATLHPGAGTAHGFSTAIEGVSPGDHQVWVYSINVGGVGTDQLLAATKVTVPPPGVGSPFGSLDLATGQAGGTARLAGWTMDLDDIVSPTRVQVYIDGPLTSGAKGMDLGIANTARPDVGTAYPGAGDAHGFDTTISGLSSGVHTLWVYALNNAGPGASSLLRTLPVTIPVGGPAPSPGALISEPIVSFRAAAPEIGVGDWATSEPVENIDMDVDGNGHRDLVRFIKSPEGKTLVDVLLSDGVSFYRPPGASPLDVGGWAEHGARVQEVAMDMNGDGKEDLLRLWKSSTGKAMTDVLFSHGTSFYRTATPIVQDMGDWGVNGEVVQRFPMLVNNDKMYDMVAVFKSGSGKAMVDVLFSNGSSGFYRPGPANPLDVGDWSTHGADVQSLVLDVNGDQLEDLLRVWKSDTGKAMTDILYSSGTSFYRPDNPIVQDIGDWGNSGQNVHNLTMDTNHDGKGDIVRLFTTAEGRRVADILYSQGTSFYRPDNAVTADIGLAEANEMWMNASKPLSRTAALFQLRPGDNQAFAQVIRAW